MPLLNALEHPAPRDCVFIHGAGGNNLLWKRTMSFFSGDGTAYAVDLPGHPSGEIACKSVTDYAEAVHSFIAEKGIRKPAVCGHSMGGAISLTLALDHPEDVGSLILVDTGAKLGVLPKLVEGLRDQPLGAIERIITPMSFHSLGLEVARESRTALSVSNLPVFLNDYLACNGFDVRNRLPQITARTLIICGESDRMTPPKWSHFMNASIPNSSAYFIREAGHMVPLEKPRPSSQLMQSFLAELSR
ncbi:MAG: alpha/beta hydrolase [Nitrososphaerota archaeon]|nr:alpha/beta hydrolase [Nitrososphaerota archaeon]